MIQYIRERKNGGNFYAERETEISRLVLDFLDRLIDKKPIRTWKKNGRK